MAKRTTLPDAASNANDKAHLPTVLPANPEAPPVPPADVPLPDEAILHIPSPPAPDWLF